MKKITWVIFISLFFSFSYTAVFAVGKEQSINERLERMERLVNSKGLVDVMVRVENMQTELQNLLGEIELQKHALSEIKKRQRDLYVDIDRRLLQIERRSVASTSPPISASTPTPAPVNKIDVVSPTVPSKKPTSTQSAKKEGEQVAYQKAFDLLRALRYEKATHAFRQFLTDYPDGRYAHIAQYWLAETSYHTRKYDIAVQDYQTLINQYPKSPKRADALLKIGYSQFELKSFSKAEDVLKNLIQSYPGTTESGQAENLLQKIRLQKVR